MKIRKGDTVKMLSGKDRSKTGKVLKIIPRENKLIVEGLNLIKKAVRARKQSQKGQIISKPRAIDVSKVMLICPSCNKPTRVGFGFEGGEKARLCKKCKSSFK